VDALDPVHRITAWSSTSAECGARSIEIIATAQHYLDDNGHREPFGRK
jgi:rhamnose utilization protein RhaD (predicted bifunctional aldolase and dehydrogenase)